MKRNGLRNNKITINKINNMSIEEVRNRFKEDIDALTYFEQLRWGNKTHCAYCQSEKVSARQIDNRFHCSSCRKTFSVTAGTFLHGSKIPLKGWLYAFASISNTTGRFSIRQLQKDINVSYTTAWQMYQDIKKLLPDLNKESIVAGNMFDYMCRKAIAVTREKKTEVVTEPLAVLV
jgi:transposase-like protein